MKLSLFLLLFAMVMGSLSRCQAASIVGTYHDFSGTTIAGGGGTGAEICKMCHVPHHAYNDGAVPVASRQAPLWNGSIDTTTTFTVYSSLSGTLLAVVSSPGPESLLCLGCHDGVTAEAKSMSSSSAKVSALRESTSGVMKIASTSNIGTDLTNTHPIGIVYDSALAALDPSVYDPTTQAAGLPTGVVSYGGTIATDMLLPRGAGTRLECPSCHDLHNGAGVRPLLLKNNSASGLCLTCHR